MNKLNMYAEQKKALFIDGKRITGYVFDEILETENEFVLYSDSIINIYDKNTGEKLFEYVSEDKSEIFRFTPDYISMEKNNKYTMYSIRGKKFSNIPFDDYCVPENHEILRRIIVCKGDKYGVYSFEGDKILECVACDDINLFKNAIKVDFEDRTSHLYSLKGNMIFTASAHDEWYTIPAGIIVKRWSSDKCGLYSPHGYKILDEIYDEIYLTDMYPYNKIEWLRVKKGGKYGVVDFNGKEILPIEFDEIQLGEGIPHSPHDYILAKKNNKYGIYSNNGKLQVPIEYEYFKHYKQDNSCLVYNEGVSGYYIIPKKKFVAADDINITKTGMYEFFIDGEWKILNI